jgi:hypothetical protein
MARRPRRAARVCGGENVRAGKPFGLAAKLVDGGDDLRIDLPREHSLDDFHRGFVRDAQALDEAGFESRLFHGAGDGFAAAMHHHWKDARRRQKNEVARDARRARRGRGIHETAAIFDDKDFAAKAQQIRQRLQQHIGFGNQVLHMSSRRLRGYERG